MVGYGTVDDDDHVGGGGDDEDFGDGDDDDADVGPLWGPGRPTRMMAELPTQKRRNRTDKSVNSEYRLDQCKPVYFLDVIAVL